LAFGGLADARGARRRMDKKKGSSSFLKKRTKKLLSI
jgi:hypothetical protein